MKKALTIFAAVMMLASVSFAQQASRTPMVKNDKNRAAMTVAMPATNVSMPKAAGDTISTFPWIESFEVSSLSELTGFTFIDSDEDGNNWTLGAAPSMRVNSGEGCIYSASWLDQVVLTPDNWMILPAFEIPSDASEFKLTWFARGQDPDYADEHYSVYICTTGNTPADFTATTAVYDGVSTDEYVKYTVSLSNYGGQTIFIAFRHWNSTDVFYLNIDDIRVGGPEPPVVAVNGPANVEIDHDGTFVATGDSVYEWSVDGDVQSATGDSMTFTFTTLGTHYVVASATNSAGTGSDTLVVNVYTCDSAITVMPWFEGFEENTFCWILATLDTTSNGFVISQSSSYAYEGTHSLFGTYSDSSDVDQWAVSPLITLPADATNYIMKYYVVMREYEGIQTSYKVYVTTESNPDTSDFTQLFEETGDSDGEYVARTLQMGAYAGQTIRIAFRNVTAQEGDAMAIDNIYIGVPVVPDMTLEGPEEVRVGDACEFTANTDFPPIEWTVDGTVVTATGTTLMYTFTTAGNHVVKASATNVAGTSSDSIVVNAVLCEAHELPYTPNLSTDIDICWENDGWGTMADQAGNTYIYSMSNFYGIFDLDPDNWIYTPALTMPAEGSFEIAWQVMPYETSLPSDHYGVYVVQNGTPTQLFQETLTANMTSFQQRVVTIPETVTGEFKVAFRHYETTGGYVILIGDIKVVTAGTTPIVGIDGVNEANVAIYPNPTTSVLRVEGEGIEQVEIIDVNGRVVMNTKAGRINVSSLADGIYMVRVVTADGVSTQKIVKK